MTKRVALLSISPLSEKHRSSLNKVCEDILYHFRLIGFHIELFSMSTRDNVSDFYGFKQHESKAHRPTSSRFTLERVSDFVFLSSLGFKPSIELLNRADNYLKELGRYSPDIIVVLDVTTAKLLKRYIDGCSGEKPRIICMCDTWRQYYLALDHANVDGIKLPLTLKNLLVNFIRKKYIDYFMSYYTLQVNLTDAFVATDDFHKEEILRRFPQLKGKIFTVLPGTIKSPALVRRRKRSKGIKTALFLGVYSHMPNFYAMEAIRLKIAPKLPEIKFIISGRDCPSKTENNVQYIGTQVSAKELLDRTDICLAPMTDENTGVRVKIFDYFAASKIVIGTRSTFIGYYVKNSYNCIIEDDLNKYALRIKELRNDTRLMEKIQKNAYTALKGHYETDTIKAWRNVVHSLNF